MPPSSSSDIAPLPHPKQPPPSVTNIRSLTDAWHLASTSMWWVLPGAAQGATTVILGHPLDTAKTRLQADTEQIKLQTRSSVKVMRQMVKREGFMSLYRGVTPPLAIMGSKRGLQFALWEQIKKAKSSKVEETPNPNNERSRTKSGWSSTPEAVLQPLRSLGNTISENNFLSGAVSGGFGTLLGCPMHVIKIQTQNVVAERGGWNAFYCTRDILRRDGFFGLYRGFKFHIIKDVMFAGTYLGMYENLRITLGNYYAIAAENYATSHQWESVQPTSMAVVTASAPSAVGSAAMSREHKRSSSPEIAQRSPTLSQQQQPSNENITSPKNNETDLIQQQRHLKARSSNLTVFTAGVLASCVTWVVLYPLDTLKTSVQARNAVNFGSFLRLMSANPTAVYRGFSAALIRAGPVSGTAMVAYETSKRWVYGPEQRDTLKR